MSDETTNQETLNNDMDNLKKYLKTGFEAGEAYTETFSRSQSPDWECIHKLTSPK